MSDELDVKARALLAAAYDYWRMADSIGRTWRWFLGWYAKPNAGIADSRRELAKSSGAGQPIWTSAVNWWCSPSIPCGRNTKNERVSRQRWRVVRVRREFLANFDDKRTTVRQRLLVEAEGKGR